MAGKVVRDFRNFEGHMEKTEGGMESGQGGGKGWDRGLVGGKCR